MKVKLTAHWRERVPGEELEVTEDTGRALISDGAAVAISEADAAGISAETEVTEVPMPPRGGQGSGIEHWAAYARYKGVDVPEDATRDDIIAALDNAGVATEVVEIDDGADTDT